MHISFLPTPAQPELKDRHLSVTIGTYDGVHRAHQRVIHTLINQAAREHTHTLVVTFHPHPQAVVNPSVAPPKTLSLPSEKYALFEQLHVEEVLDLQFTQEIAHLRAEEFLEELAAYGGVRNLVVGHDFKMGYKAHGTLSFLSDYCASHDIVFTVIPEQRIDGSVVSSTQIRNHLLKGEVADANLLLGYPYCVTGAVVHGEEVGRSLGFPTANLEVHPDKCLPEDGVYATWAWIDGRWRQSTTSIGVRPTFNGTSRVIETHVHDYEGVLYDQKVTIAFVARLRSQQRYDKVEALIHAMDQDTEESARRLDLEPGRHGGLVPLPSARLAHHS